MESGNTDKDAAGQAKDALVLYEPGEESGEGKRWILLHVLLERSPLEPTADDDGLLRLSNNFNDWCRWRDENAGVVTGTIIFSEAPDNPKDMLIDSLFIEKPYRRQGYGRRLVEGMKTVCRQRGRSRMLAATQFRAKAMPFWMAMGLQRDLETGTPFIPVVSSSSDTK